MLAHATQTLSVSELNQQASQCLEQQFRVVHVVGEISNLACPSSGHWYFSLKDQHAQVRCAFFKARHRNTIPVPKNGDEVLVLARVSLYAPRGDYQLIIQQLTPHGEGRWHIAFEQLKTKLDAKGWFREEHRQPLPKYPKRIGIIASPTSAALQDILNVTRRRFPAIPLIIYPCIVQGEKAADSICQALESAHQRQEVDVLLLARGGGSIEDLWPFNEERVAQAIFNSQLPVVTGIGHEIDHTIADFVADQRGATPSAAAELITPDQSEIQQQLTALHDRLIHAMKRLLKQQQVQLGHLKKRLIHPSQQLAQQQTTLTALQERLTLSIHRLQQQQAQALDHHQARLLAQSPDKVIHHARNSLNADRQRLHQCMTQQVKQQRDAVHLLARTLDAHSPLKTLERGYAIVHHRGSTTTDISAINPGDTIAIQVHHGSLECTVDEINTEKS
tara:strand:- start:2104 stop:3444 length:1341 start_codon:yes stop_codon:yes gene_type:complete